MYGMSSYGLWWIILAAVLIVWPFWRIFSKAGYPGALALLMLIPLVNIAMIWFLAFARWPYSENQPLN